MWALAAVAFCLASVGLGASDDCRNDGECHEGDVDVSALLQTKRSQTTPQTDEGGGSEPTHRLVFEELICPAPPLTGVDDASKQLLSSAGPGLQNTGFGKLKASGALRLQFQGRGIARLAVGLLPNSTFVGRDVLVRLNGVPVVEVPGDTHCNVSLAFRTGDVLELSAAGDPAGGKEFWLESLEVLQHQCEDGLPGQPAEQECRNFNRMRLPWTYCEGDSGLVHRWVEGRLARVINSTHSVVQVARPTVAYTKQALFPEFDPKSPLTSYSDKGSCGPRGDDARANFSTCKEGAARVKVVPFRGQDTVAAAVDGCEYTAYEVFVCKENLQSGTRGSRDHSRLVVPRGMLTLLQEKDLAEKQESNDWARGLPRCAPFKPDARKITIVTVADSLFQERYKKQIQSLRCFADRMEYGFRLLGSTEFKECAEYNVFFGKHCSIAKWLETQEENATVAVLDADVVAGVLNRGLEKWANSAADLQFYQRCLLQEIVAGNYMLRNTPYARTFLRDWAAYQHVMPPGFSSADNGAIHLAVQKATGAGDYDRCYKLYTGLSKDVTDLSDYFAYTKCVLDALGPPRVWKGNGGIIEIWPRFNYWAADGVYLSWQFAVEVGPVIHHGIKNSSRVDKYFADVGKCEVNAANFAEADEVGERVMGLAHSYPNYFSNRRTCNGTLQRKCPGDCLCQLRCMPLEDKEAPLVPRGSPGRL